MCTMIKKEGDNKEIGSEIIDREIREVRESVKHILKTAANRQYKTNLTKEEIQGKKKALQDKTKVFLPADKGHVMVAMDKYENEGGEQSYEHKMKQVLVDLKVKPLIRANNNNNTVSNQRGSTSGKRLQVHCLTVLLQTER